MDKIIDRVDRNLIVSELTHDKLLRHANKGVNEVYVVDAFNAPNTMREIGRLREIAFRDAGGGTGLACDIDEFDTMDSPAASSWSGIRKTWKSSVATGLYLAKTSA